MKKMAFAVLIGLASFTIFAFVYNNDCTEGEGGIVDQKISIDDFNKILLQNSISVYITQGNELSVYVKGQQNIIDLLQTEVNNNTWKINFEKCVKQMKDFEVHITMPELAEASIAGSGDIEIKSFNSTLEELNLNIYGSGDIKLNGDVHKINTQIKGSGDMKLSGKAKALDIKIAGSGDITADECVAEDVSISIKGSGDAKVNASKSIHVAVAGSGDVFYKGNPSDIKQDIKGSGEVSKIN